MEKKYAVQTIKIARVFPKINYKRKRLLIMYSQNNILSPYIPCRLSESSGQKYLLSKKNNANSKGHFFCLENFWSMLVKGKICCSKICFEKTKKNMFYYA